MNTTSPHKNQPPIVSCSANTTFGYAPLYVSFQGSGTDPDGMIVSYYWDFGDGIISRDQNPNHLYNKTGTYAVFVTVIDDDGAIDNDHIEITVGSKPDNPPTAQFTYSPSSPCDLDVIQFIDKSTDGDGYIVSWLWDFGDEGTSTLQNPTYKYGDHGTYHVTLAVLDDDDEGNSISKEILVSNVQPTAKFTYSPSSPNDLDVIQFADKSIDIDGYIVSWLWDFGDGNASSKQNPSHAYATAGMYDIKLTVKDNDDSASETIKEIRINEQPDTTTVLTLTYNGEQKTYTLEELENFDSTTGYGGRINKLGIITGPFEYKGVSISTLANEFLLTSTSFTITTMSADGYTYNYTQDEVQGNVQVYDTEGNEQGIGGVTMMLAYEENGTQNFSGGPLRIAFVNDDEPITLSSLWAKNVIEIEFF